MKVLVTGADGFVGTALCAHLQAQGMEVVSAVRRMKDVQVRVPAFAVGAIGPDTDWSGALQGCQAVVHLAAHVHQTGNVARNGDTLFDIVNSKGSENLGRQAALAGVQRFVFMSSVKVHGEFTSPGSAFVESDLPAPQDAYAKSKLAAEQVLTQLSQQNNIGLTILRSPLVYGRGAKANLSSLLRAVSLGWPLPFGALRNARSLVGLDNLVDAISLCVMHPAAAGETFLVSDGTDVSTRDLVIAMGLAIDRPVRLISVPSALINLGCVMTGRRDIATRLLGNLQVDSSKLRNVLGWVPPMPVNAGLRKAFSDTTA